MASGNRVTDGQFSWELGVDSGRISTLRSDLIPNGLQRAQLAWLNNGTVRGGGITQRTGWLSVVSTLITGSLFQGGFMYDNSKYGTNPYLVLSIGGRIYSVLVEAPYTVTDMSAVFGLTNPAAVEKAYFIQAEEFLIIQAGDADNPGAPNPPVTDADGRTLPLIWDGQILRRSLGIIGNIDPYLGAVNELPAGTCMDYYMGRVWIGHWNGQRRVYAAGDIVQGSAGTAPYEFRDSVLKVTENPLAIGGDGFTVPSQAGDIRAINHAATLDTVLGQGPLFIFTRKAVYKLTVPVTRTDWIGADNNNQPIQTLAQKTNGTYSDRSVVSMNGDLFYQSPDGIRSLMMAIRYYTQWGNTPISNNEERVLQFNDRSMMRTASGMEFDNRLWMTALPFDTGTVGTAFKAIIPLDFDLISSLQEKLPPAWEGMYEGLDFLQLFSGDFGGRQRAFSAIHSTVTGEIEIWEFTQATRFENGDNRVQWTIEFPAYNWAGKMEHAETEIKTLDGGELWIDKLFGTVEMDVFYRVDANPCWQLWYSTSFCAARSSCENVYNPICYPEQPYSDYREGSKFPITLPKPPVPSCEPMNMRPMNIGYQFQVKLVIKGWCRIRGIMLHAIPTLRRPYEGVGC